MNYKEFIQQYVIHNHGNMDTERVINTAVYVANELVKRGFLKPYKPDDND